MRLSVKEEVAMYRIQEVRFKCFYCGEEIDFDVSPCPHCDTGISWDGVEIWYQDKYLEIWDIGVK